jgi:hypothetical protein
MKWSCLVVIVAILATITPAQADTDCPNGRCPIARVVTAPVRALKTVIVEPSSVPVAVTTTPRRVTVSAQEHADALASTGGFHHCRNYGGGYEGLGFSTSSDPQDAVRRCCFWGQRKPREIATSWCPHRRGYVAVVRYE